MCELSPTTLSDLPWDLLMDIAKLSFTGNWSLRNSNCRSDGIRGILGMKASSSLHWLVIMVASGTWCFIAFTANIDPLQKMGWSKILSSMIGALFFEMRLWWESSGGCKEFRNSTGYWMAWLDVAALSLDLNCCNVPDWVWRSPRLIWSTILFF